MTHQKKLTAYELRRLENIKRNDEMLASLKIHSKINDLSASTKRQRAQIKSYKNGLEKKSKIETPTKTPKSNPNYESSGPNYASHQQKFTEKIMGVLKKPNCVAVITRGRKLKGVLAIRWLV
ncbi:unnamed protein product [Camellia sinensis]